jgi:RimJ/RimL family protein N-acetyltransferase
MTRVRGSAVAVARRAATPEDIPFLRSLFEDAHLELAALPTDSRYVLVDMQFRAQRRQHAAQHPNATHEILIADGSSVGRVLVDRSCEPIEIVDVTVALSHRGEGIAADVVSGIVREADAHRRAVELTVWSGNAAAVALARGAGFAPCGSEAGYVTYVRSARPDGASASN